MDQMALHRDRPTAVFLTVAALWSAGLVVLAFTLAGSESTTAVVTVNGHAHSLVGPSLTLVQENGFKVLVPIGLPAASVAVVALALRRRRRHGRIGPGPLAVGATIAVGLVSVLGLLTIGPFILPVAVLLVLACTRATEQVRSSALTGAVPLRVGSMRGTYRDGVAEAENSD
jgi:hypothetical protein